MDRKLAAILAADVVGYSRLIEQDEAGTFERLRALRKTLFEPTIAKHHGRVFKLMGDGLLAEFASVVDAVECAVALQQHMTEHNLTVQEENHRIECRIGINLGDVILEKDDEAIDVHGEGVIIANRLQALAQPGGICVSQTVVNHVGNKVAIGFGFSGEHRVKNIAHPVRVYRVRTGMAADAKTIGIRSWQWPTAATLVVVMAAAAAVWWRPWEPAIEAASIERMALPLPDRPSIAVLPFANMSGDPKQEYFADGMTDDLITELSKVSGLFVISRNSSFAYKGKSATIAQVAEELGVRYLLEGSVQRAGDRVRINAQLIDGLNGGHLWADRFDGSLSDVFALQDEVTNSVADALALRLTAAEQTAVSRQETTVPAAYDAFLRGWEHYRRSTLSDYTEAISYLKRAIGLDPEFGRAYAALALVYFSAYDRWWHESLGLTYAEAKEKAGLYLAEAQRRPTSTSHQVAGNILRFAGSYEQALSEFRAAIAIDPSDSWNYAFLAETLNAAGRPAEAVPNIRTAMRLDPHYPAAFLRILGLAQFGLKQYENAAASLTEAAEMSPDDSLILVALIATYGYLDRKQDAALAVARYNAVAAELGQLPLTVEGAPPLAVRFPPSRRTYIGSVPPSEVSIRTGLQMAGVPFLITKHALGEKNRLTGAELRSVVFGHQLRGHDYGYHGSERSGSITADGVANFSGDWGHWRETTAAIEGDQLCLKAQFDPHCFDAFRYPGGTKAKLNEYILFSSRGAFMFSQVD